MLQKSRKIVAAQLALKDLCHDWLISACLIISIAAVAIPLLILLGLKSGTINFLHEQLLQDPVNRELRPARTSAYSEQWFDEFSLNPEVEFLIPTIMNGSAVVRVKNNRTGSIIRLDIIPTAAGDPLLLGNSATIPGKNQNVLTHSAAEKLGVKSGEDITILVSRMRNGKKEIVDEMIKVVSILDPRADSQDRIYTEAQFVYDVEAFREGQKVEHRKWSGGNVKPVLSYDGLFIITSQELHPITFHMLTIGTGFSNAEKTDNSTLQDTLGLTLKNGDFAYQLTTINSSVQSSNVSRVREKLRGQNAIILPYAQGLTSAVNGQPVELVGLSLTPHECERLGIKALPWSQHFTHKNWSGYNQILPATNIDVDGPFIIENVGKNTISFELTSHSVTEDIHGFSIVPVELIGILKTGMSRGLVIDKSGNITVGKNDFFGFRLYADTLDNVSTLKSKLWKSGIETLSKDVEIQKLKAMDAGLTRSVLFLIVVGVSGGIAVLNSGLFSSIERKLREISVMRIIGFDKKDMVAFTLTQSFIISITGVSIALLVYFPVSHLVNGVFTFSDNINVYCKLEGYHMVAITLVSLIFSIKCSALAMIKMGVIDISDAVRHA